MLTGVNVTATAALARAVRLPVIASGGVAGVEDIVALRAEGAGIEGAILGRALYDGRIEPKVALVAAG
jgi:phosphoribosylformimino-5-aminoimidazole carboxamide ribotide isomerase